MRFLSDFISLTADFPRGFTSSYSQLTCHDSAYLPFEYDLPKASETKITTPHKTKREFLNLIYNHGNKHSSSRRELEIRIESKRTTTTTSPEENNIHNHSLHQSLSQWPNSCPFHHHHYQFYQFISYQCHTSCACVEQPMKTS